MNTKQKTKSADSSLVIRRVITASAFRKIHSSNTRLKKARKALRRMKKEKDE
jgi:hypothetical protein